MTTASNYYLSFANIIMVIVSIIGWWINGEAHSTTVFVMWFILLGISVAMMNFSEYAGSLTDKKPQELDYRDQRRISRYNTLCTLQIVFWIVQTALVIWSFYKGTERSLTFTVIWLCFATLNLIYGLIDKKASKLKFGRRILRLAIENVKPKEVVKSVNVVNLDIHYNDNRRITAVDIKLKSTALDSERKLTGHELVATVSAGFFRTTLLTNSGGKLEVKPNESRNDIVNLIVSFEEDNDLTVIDIANFITAFQYATDEVNLF